MRMVNKCITCNTRFRLIGFGETSVDNQQLATSLNWFLSFQRFYGHMTIDNVGMWSRFHAKFQQYAIACFGLIAQGIIISFRFLLGFFVGKEVALESSHLVFVERRGIGAAPHVPHVILGKPFPNIPYLQCAHA